MSVNIDIVQIFNRIWDAASIYLAKPRSRVQNLGRAADRLKAKLEDVVRTIEEDERNGQTAAAVDLQWKRAAEEFLSTKVAAIQQDYGARRCWGGWSWSCVSINRRVTKELIEVQGLISRGDGIRVAAPLPPPAAAPLPLPPPAAVIQIVNLIRNENVIGIYGMEVQELISGLLLIPPTMSMLAIPSRIIPSCQLVIQACHPESALLLVTLRSMIPDSCNTSMEMARGYTTHRQQDDQSIIDLMFTQTGCLVNC